MAVGDTSGGRMSVKAMHKRNLNCFTANPERAGNSNKPVQPAGCLSAVKILTSKHTTSLIPHTAEG